MLYIIEYAFEKDKPPKSLGLSLESCPTLVNIPTKMQTRCSYLRLLHQLVRPFD